MEIDKRNIIERLFIPRYNELVLFLMSISFILVFITDADLIAHTHDVLIKEGIPIALIFFALGIIYSIYHVFTNREKTAWEKSFLLFFAVMVNGGCGIAVGFHLLDNSHGLYVVLPIWNLLNAFILLVTYRSGIIGSKRIDDDNATYFQVILGTIVVVTTFSVCHFIFELYWAITFSICVTYACNINGTVQSIFSRT
jgi:hypothetical protein